MNSDWSSYIQTTEELYRSRALRFNPMNKDIWLSALQIEGGMDVLEVGCAGGIFCHRIKTFLPLTHITGIDLDNGHIEYANNKTKELGIDCTFTCCDATAMPFIGNSFDLCYSYTVMEHIEPNAFLSEQYRVLKNGGKIVVLSVRQGLSFHTKSTLLNECEESELNRKAWQVCSDFEKQAKVCAYPLKENEFAPIMEKIGFNKIKMDFFTIMSYSPDNSDVSEDIAIESINVNRLFALNGFYKAQKLNPSALSNSEMERAIELVNQRFDKRIESFMSGEKIWDFNASTVMAVTGTK